MRKIGFSSKQLSRFKYRRDGILLNGEKRYVNAALQAGDVLEIRLTQGGEAAERPDTSVGGAPGEDVENGKAGAYLAARDGRLQKIWVKPADWLSERFPLKILYEDGDILAADKPSGVVCHPSPGHFDDTLSNQVAEHLGRIGQELDVRVTGRLDKDTSGIVVFALNTETAAQLIKKELGIEHGSKVPQRDKVGKLTQEQLTKIAEIKMPDLNANDIEAAKAIVAGTARSMGVTVED